MAVEVQEHDARFHVFTARLQVLATSPSGTSTHAIPNCLKHMPDDTELGQLQTFWHYFYLMSRLLKRPQVIASENAAGLLTGFKVYMGKSQTFEGDRPSNSVLRHRLVYYLLTGQLPQERQGNKSVIIDKEMSGDDLLGMDLDALIAMLESEQDRMELRTLPLEHQGQADGGRVSPHSAGLVTDLDSDDQMTQGHTWESQQPSSPTSVAQPVLPLATRFFSPLPSAVHTSPSTDSKGKKRSRSEDGEKEALTKRKKPSPSTGSKGTKRKEAFDMLRALGEDCICAVSPHHSDVLLASLWETK
ncbi:hypothetical protein EON64_16620 [archaeon]|nr:MAG: hypothetical protein EON64_16620 [archaeon]